MNKSINQTLFLNVTKDAPPPEYLECADVFVKMDKDLITGYPIATLMVLPHPFDPVEERSAYRLGSTEYMNVHNNEEWTDAFADVLDNIPDEYRYWVGVDQPPESDDDTFQLLLAAYVAAVAYIESSPCDPDTTKEQQGAWIEFLRARKELEAYE